VIKNLRSRVERDTSPPPHPPPPARGLRGAAREQPVVRAARVFLQVSRFPFNPTQITRRSIDQPAGSMARERLNSPGENGNGGPAKPIKVKHSLECPRPRAKLIRSSSGAPARARARRSGLRVLRSLISAALILLLLSPPTPHAPRPTPRAPLAAANCIVVAPAGKLRHNPLIRNDAIIVHSKGRGGITWYSN
jgi:hypothetical protein